MFFESVLGDSSGTFALGAKSWFVNSSLLLLISLQIERARCFAKISFLAPAPAHPHTVSNERVSLSIPFTPQLSSTDRNTHRCRSLSNMNVPYLHEKTWSASASNSFSLNSHSDGNCRINCHTQSSHKRNTGER